MELLKEQEQKTRIKILAGLLYLITAGLGVLSFFTGRRVVLSTLSRFGVGVSQSTSQNPFSLFNILVSFTLAFLVIAIVIGGFEYHFRKVGTEESWWMFARTLGVEFGILLLASFL
jgi:hypothetical protein